MYLVQGISHFYQPYGNMTVNSEKEIRFWSAQWTTPNNTEDTIADTEDEAVRLWTKQRLVVPNVLNKSDIYNSFTFKLRITQFENGYARQWHTMEVRMRHPEEVT